MGNGPNPRMHFDFWSEFVFHFAKTVEYNDLKNEYSNSHDHCDQEPIERTSKHINEIFYEGLKMGHDVKVLMHLDACSEFAINFLQNHTVKILENSYSNS